MTKRVAIALSGGIDSAVAAYLLKQQGYKVIALTAFLFDDFPSQATSIAGQMGIEHHILDMKAEFDELVIQPFLQAYRHGLTPNPCCVCNHQIKFGLLSKAAQQLEADFWATGHYVCSYHNQDGYHLQRGVDSRKDQSYFLFSLNQSQLVNTVFPLGALKKEAVKSLAKELGIQAGPSSQDICFVKGDLPTFLGRNLELKTGLIADETGRILGEHSGLALYTVGQRQGLGVSWSTPLYVKELHTTSNTLVLAPRSSLMARQVRLGNVSWISGNPPRQKELLAQVRYGSTAQPARWSWDKDAILVELAKPLFAPALGQYLVFYQESQVLGGGQIEGWSK